MKTLKLFIIPFVLLLIIIVSSILSFNYSKDLELGYLNIEDESPEVVYTGDYFAIVGNLGEIPHTISVASNEDGIQIEMYDNQDAKVKDYTVVVKEENSPYNQEIVDSILSSEKVVIDDLDEYPFTLKLDKNKIYDFSIIRNYDVDNEDIDVLLINLNDEIATAQSISEMITYIAAIFAFISTTIAIVLAFFNRQ